MRFNISDLKSERKDLESKVKDLESKLEELKIKNKGKLENEIDKISADIEEAESVEYIHRDKFQIFLAVFGLFKETYPNVMDDNEFNTFIQSLSQFKPDRFVNVKDERELARHRRMLPLIYSSDKQI